MSKLIAFRITNFRSIVDSNWVTTSQDDITVFVGQNESGKSSVLQALHYALNRDGITSDDKRIGTEGPVVTLRISTAPDELVWKNIRNCNEVDQTVIKKFLGATSGVLDIRCSWIKGSPKDSYSEYEMQVALLDPDAFLLLQEAVNSSATQSPAPAPAPSSTDIDQSSTTTEVNSPANTLSTISANDVAELIYEPLPYSVFFDAESGLLPSSVDIDDKGKPKGTGAVAATNFLNIAGIDLHCLIAGDGRYRQNILLKANRRVSEDFTSFWSQIIGTDAKLSLECEFQHYSNSAGEQAGKPHLVFWISDGTNKLYPKQRSLGVRWFVSFYLQLSATKKAGNRRFFLLDEPSANLHSKAQADVLKLINSLRNDIAIFYSTHSPQMIEYEKLYRVRAVQRDGSKEDSPTVVIDAHQLGTASTDTLSPILAAMGTDISHQTVIQKQRNVLLEEMSGYYYFKAFWRLTNCQEAAHFMAATGVNKLPTLVNMFLGWGLDFVVAVDDDKQGREVYKQLKRELCADQDDLAKKLLLKIPECPSIEEAFTSIDFAKHVLRNPKLVMPQSNSDYLKNEKLSKPVTALQFLLSVERGEVNLNAFEAESQRRINAVVKAVADLLKETKPR